MIKKDLHMHTFFCDGKDSPEDMVLSAIGKGLDCVGICAHSHTSFDESFCLELERYGEFQAEISRLKEKYKGKIEVLCGVEQDLYSEAPTDGFDYVIGSVHYLTDGQDYAAVDEFPELLQLACDSFYGGDFYALAEAYFESVSLVCEKTGCDIIGHIDLITKFNENGEMFDESHPRYVAAYEAAVDRLVKFGKPFEVNTGAISRGYRTSPYPSKSIADYIVRKGGKLIFSSDAHCAENIAYLFDKFEIEY